MSQDYTKREIDLITKGLSSSMKDTHEHIAEKLEQILEQTTRTNGRVSRLENWKAWITGSIGVILPVLSYIVYKLF
jgi:hypothetical protein